MTPEQYRLYTGMLRLFRLFGTGGATWVGIRPSGDGISAVRTASLLGTVVLRFLENNRIREALAAPQTALYTAAWWGLAATGADIQAGDVYSNGSIAFLVTGTPDTSQGFTLIPAAPCTLPVNHARRLTRQGLRIGTQAGM